MIWQKARQKTQVCILGWIITLFAFLKKKRPSKTVGIEIRRDGVALAELRHDAKTQQAQVVGCEFRPISHPDDIKRACEEMVRARQLAGAACHVVLSVDDYQTFPVEKPKVDAAEVIDAVKWKVKDLLDFDIGKAVIDGFPVPQDALRGRGDMITAVVSKRQVIQNRVDLIQQLGLDLQSIDITDLALRNICMQIQAQQESPRAVALLHLRDGAGMMVIVKAQDLYMARHFDFFIASLNDPSRQDQVIQQLGLEVQRSFDYFESQMGQVPPRDLLLFGPDPSIPLANMIGGSIAAKVVVLDPAQTFYVRTPDVSALDEINTFVAQGAALRGVGMRADDGKGADHRAAN